MRDNFNYELSMIMLLCLVGNKIARKEISYNLETIVVIEDRPLAISFHKYMACHIIAKLRFTLSFHISY